MHSHFLDSYSHVDGPIQRLPAAAKATAALTLILVLVTVPASPILFAVVALFLVLVAAASRVPGAFLAKRLVFLEPFVLGAAVLTLFQPNGRMIFLTVATRSTLCLLVLVLLSNTTPFSDLLGVLKRARVPGLIITTVALMHRYLYVLKDESDRMRSARASRTFTRDRPRAWRTLATVIGHLFIRSSQRATRVYWAMCSRGWT